MNTSSSLLRRVLAAFVAVALGAAPPVLTAHRPTSRSTCSN